MEIKFLKKKKVFKEKSFRLSPAIYWRIVLGTFFALVIVAALFGYYTFVQINRDLVFSTTGAGDAKEKGKIEKVEDILRMFDERAEKSKEIRNTASGIIDPSL